MTEGWFPVRVETVLPEMRAEQTRSLALVAPDPPNRNRGRPEASPPRGWLRQAMVTSACPRGPPEGERPTQMESVLYTQRPRVPGGQSEVGSSRPRATGRDAGILKIHGAQRPRSPEGPVPQAQVFGPPRGRLCNSVFRL